jgi:phosphoglycolate phosphatase
MIDAVIFDKDGTLFDFQRSWGEVAVTVLGQLAQNEAHAADLAAAMGFDRASGRFAPDSPMIAGTSADIAAVMIPLLPHMTPDALEAHLNRVAVSARMHPAVDLRHVLQDLRSRGLRLGVATNDTEAPARAHLAEAGITDLFDFVAGCDSGHGAKPEPGMLLAFSQALGLESGRVVMVGDSRHDLVAGRAAGMRVVGVLTGIADHAELEPHADVVLPDIAGLAGWIDSLSAD